MEIKDVIGDNSPEKFEKLQGGTLINTKIEEIVNGEVVKFKYKQMFVTETNEEKLDKLFNLFTIKVCKDYLASTAWYVERLSDPSSGKAIPVEILTKRSEARELINTLEAELGGL